MQAIAWPLHAVTCSYTSMQAIVWLIARGTATGESEENSRASTASGKGGGTGGKGGGAGGKGGGASGKGGGRR